MHRAGQAAAHDRRRSASRDRTRVTDVWDSPNERPIAAAVTGELDRLARSTRPCTAGRPAGARCGCCTSRPGRTPAAPRPRPGAPSPGRPVRPNPPRRSGSPPGKPRPHAAKCRPCRRCTSRSRRSPPRAPGVHRPCWTMRPSARPRGSRWPRCKSCTRSGRWPSSGSRCTGRSPSSRRAPTARRWSTRWPGWPSPAGPAPSVVQVTAPDIADVTSLGVRASDGGSIYRPPNEERYCTLAHLDIEEQILAAAKRTVPQLVSREQARAAAERHRAERRAARRRGDDAHRDRGHDRAGRPGRGGQEPHHGRVRPAVDHLHRPPRHRPDHLHQRRPGPGARGPGRELQHRRSSSARSKAPTNCAAPSRCTRTTCSSWTRPASSPPPTWP